MQGRHRRSGVTVNRYPPPPPPPPPRYQIAGDMVPAGVAFPHYDNFRCGYNITSEIVPSHRVAGHQRAHQVTKSLAGVVQSRPRGRVEASGNYSGAAIAFWTGPAQQNQTVTVLLKVDGYG